MGIVYIYESILESRIPVYAWKSMDQINNASRNVEQNIQNVRKYKF